MCTACVCTVLPEIFAAVLFSLNFLVGVGPHKLSARNFLRTQNFDHVKIIATVELLLCSSFSFLDQFLTISLLWYLKPVSNKCQGTKWVCLTYCTHAESSYVAVKLASSDLPFVERSVCQANSCELSLTFVTLNFCGVLISRLPLTRKV